MSSADVMKRIRHTGIVPAVRVPSADQARRAVAALVEGGVTVVEIPITVPGAFEVIAEVRARSGDEIVVGAGTVTDIPAATQAIDAGAQFVVSPSLHLDVIEFCKRLDIAIMPGALSPTEIITAWQAGADGVKVFPISAVGGVRYLKALRAPFPEVQYMPMGGVQIGNAAEYFLAGAFAVGVGSDLVSVSALSQGRDDELVDAAKEYVAQIKEARKKLSQTAMN